MATNALFGPNSEAIRSVPQAENRLTAWELAEKCTRGQFGIPRNSRFCYELLRLLPPQPGLNISACRYPHRPGPCCGGVQCWAELVSGCWRRSEHQV